MPDFCDDPIDREARAVTQMMASGDHLSAARRLQEDAVNFRPGEYTELLGEVKGMSKVANTPSHLEMTPIPSYDGDSRGAINVAMVSPATDQQGRQYIDQDGRPMAVVANIATIDNHAKLPIITPCPRVELPPPPCHVERPWLIIDEHRERVRFDVGFKIGDVNVHIGGDNGRYGGGGWDRGGGWGGGDRYGRRNDGWIGNHDGQRGRDRNDGWIGNHSGGGDRVNNNQQVIVNETTVNNNTTINNTKVDNSVHVNQRVEQRGGGTVVNNTRVETHRPEPRPQPQPQPQQNGNGRGLDHMHDHDTRQKKK